MSSRRLFSLIPFELDYLLFVHKNYFKSQIIILRKLEIYDKLQKQKAFVKKPSLIDTNVRFHHKFIIYKICCCFQWIFCSGKPLTALFHLFYFACLHVSSFYIMSYAYCLPQQLLCDCINYVLMWLYSLGPFFCSKYHLKLLYSLLWIG